MPSCAPSACSTCVRTIDSGCGRSPAAPRNDLVDVVFEQPVLNARFVETRLSVSRPAALAARRQLADVGILAEMSGAPRRQLRWRAQQILEVLTGE